MADVASRADYLAQLQALLPSGAAWPRGPDTTLTRLLDALAADLARLDAAAGGLLAVARPDTIGPLLDDWDRVMGLPDACSAGASDVEERLRALLSHITIMRSAGPRRYEEIARQLGYAAAVVEHDESAAGRLPGLDTTGGRWRYVWWLQVHVQGRIGRKNVLSGVDAPLRENRSDAELECRIRAAAPIHTHPVIEWVETDLIVATRTDLHRVDPATGAATRLRALGTALPARGASMSLGRRLVYVTRGGAVHQIDPATGRVTRLAAALTGWPARVSRVGGATVGGEHLILTRAITSAESHLLELDPAAWSVRDRGDVETISAGGLAAVRGELYTLDDGLVLDSFDPVTREIRRLLAWSNILVGGANMVMTAYEDRLYVWPYTDLPGAVIRLDDRSVTEIPAISGASAAWVWRHT